MKTTWIFKDFSHTFWLNSGMDWRKKSGIVSFLVSWRIFGVDLLITRTRSSVVDRPTFPAVNICLGLMLRAIQKRNFVILLVPGLSHVIILLLDPVFPTLLPHLKILIPWCLKFWILLFLTILNSLTWGKSWKDLRPYFPPCPAPVCAVLESFRSEPCFPYLSISVPWDTLCLYLQFLQEQCLLVFLSAAMKRSLVMGSTLFVSSLVCLEP